VDMSAKLREAVSKFVDLTNQTERIVKDKVAELGTPADVVAFLEVERKMEHDRAVELVESAVKPKSGQGWGHRAEGSPPPPRTAVVKRSSDYPVPEGDADQGVVLAEILAALF
jgi:hypothetical protein